MESALAAFALSLLFFNRMAAKVLVMSALHTPHSPHEIASDPVMGTYGPRAFVAVRGEGSYLFDEGGKAYLDFTSGIAVTSLGHCHPKLVRALTDQAQTLWHASNLFEMPGQAALAHLLCQDSFADKVFFTNSGAEALECAIKTARRYHAHKGDPARHRIITFHGGFHGRTMATIAAAGQEKLTAGFGPMLAGFDHVPVGDFEAVTAAVTDETAAILIEPILGEGGIQVVPAEFLASLRTLCDAHGLLLIYDEVQCGIGRTGDLFAHQASGALPDIMALAKGLGGGFPIGACLATSAACAGMTPGSHGSTFGGNPLAVAVGKAVIEEILAPGFLHSVRDKGAALYGGLTQLKSHYPTVIEEVRGTGLMLGLKLKTPNGAFVAAARSEGLLCVPAGDNVVRLLPPLNVQTHEIEDALDALTKTLAQEAASGAAI